FDAYMSFLRRNAAGQSDLSRLSTLHYCFYQMSANLSLGELFDDLPTIYDEVLAIRGMLGSFQISDRVAHDHRELLPLQQAVREKRQELKAIAFSTDPGRDERLQKVSDDKEFAESELALATRPFVPPDLELSWQELQAAPPPRTAFVDFVQFIHHSPPESHRGRLVRQRRMLAYILKKTGAPECIRLGSSQAI